MILKHLTVLCLAVGGASAGAALAQTADSLNPAVNTSPAQAPPATTSQAVPAAPEAAPPVPGAAEAAAKAVPAAHDPSAGAAAPRTASAATAAADTSAPISTAATASASVPGTSDRIELGTTEISGNRELPKLMYIVPWQRAAVGKITGRPPNSLVDEALTPVDRTVFERQNNYFAALQAASASAPSQPAAPGAPPAAAGLRDEK